jgi:hypothetical protein
VLVESQSPPPPGANAGRPPAAQAFGVELVNAEALRRIRMILGDSNSYWT